MLKMLKMLKMLNRPGTLWGEGLTEGEAENTIYVENGVGHHFQHIYSVFGLPQNRCIC